MSENKWALRNIHDGISVSINQSTLKAGRKSSDEIVCKGSVVSRTHATFFLMEENLFVQDNGVGVTYLYN